MYLPVLTSPHSDTSIYFYLFLFVITSFFSFSCLAFLSYSYPISLVLPTCLSVFLLVLYISFEAKAEKEGHDANSACALTFDIVKNNCRNTLNKE